MRWVLALPFLVAPGFAVAEDCAGADGLLEQSNCYVALYEQVDAELNAIWPRVLAEHPSGGDFDEHTRLIRESQRAWIRFRDADCEAAAQVGVGSYWGLNTLVCKVEHTRARIRALSETYLD